MVMRYGFQGLLGLIKSFPVIAVAASASSYHSNRLTLTIGGLFHLIFTGDSHPAELLVSMPACLQVIVFSVM